MLRDRADAFDQWMDQRLDRWRGRPVVDTFAYGASAIGDHGLAWFLIGVARGWRPGPRRAAAVWAVVFTGVVTPVLNSRMKSTVQRPRPDDHDREDVPIRIPRSTSFPSGHTLAAWCAATILADGDVLAPGYYALAAAVSYSRVHVRHHHATDVVAGTILGIALGRLGRRLTPVVRN